MVEKLTLMSPEERANLRLDDVPRFNSMHTGHIQRLYSEQVCAVCAGIRGRARVWCSCITYRFQQHAYWPHVHLQSEQACAVCDGKGGGHVCVCVCVWRLRERAAFRQHAHWPHTVLVSNEVQTECARKKEGGGRGGMKYGRG
eukprot:1158921-Pelagomonas_calceolata.AAC.5